MHTAGGLQVTGTIIIFANATNSGSQFCYIRLLLTGSTGHRGLPRAAQCWHPAGVDLACLKSCVRFNYAWMTNHFNGRAPGCPTIAAVSWQIATLDFPSISLPAPALGHSVMQTGWCQSPRLPTAPGSDVVAVAFLSTGPALLSASRGLLLLSLSFER